MNKIWQRIHEWLVPSHRNDFHPHLLAARGLLVLFALVLGAEGFLVSSVVSSEPGEPTLAAVGGATQALALPPYLGGLSRQWTRYVIMPIAHLAALPGAGRLAYLSLACLAALLMGVLALTLSMRRRRVKKVGYIAGGTMLAFAATLMLFNMQVVLPSAAHTEASVYRAAEPLASTSPSR